jgi:hypothetical protein
MADQDQIETVKKKVCPPRFVSALGMVSGLLSAHLHVGAAARKRA